MAGLKYDHYWRVQTRLAARWHHSCRVLARARRMNSVLVEFADGEKVVTSRNYIRKITEGVRPDEEAAR